MVEEKRLKRLLRYGKEKNNKIMILFLFILRLKIEVDKSMNRKVYKHGIIYNCAIEELITSGELDYYQFNHIITDPPYGLLEHKIESNVQFTEIIDSLRGYFTKDTLIAFFGMEPSYSQWASHIYQFLPFQHEIIWNKGNSISIHSKIKKIHEKICICGNGKINDYKIDFLEKLEYQEINKDLIKRKINMFRECFSRYNGNDIKNYMLGKFNEIKNMRVYTSDNNMESIVKDFKRNDPVLSSVSAMLGIRMVNIESVIRLNPENNQNRRQQDTIKHPTVKPIPLLEILIKLISQEHEVIFDPFIGSGSTAVACLKNNRKFIGCELDKEYFDLTCRRIENEYHNNLFLQ